MTDAVAQTTHPLNLELPASHSIVAASCTIMAASRLDALVMTVHPLNCQDKRTPEQGTVHPFNGHLKEEPAGV